MTEQKTAPLNIAKATVEDAVGRYMHIQSKLKGEKGFGLMEAAVVNYLMSDGELMETPLQSLTTAMINAWQLRAIENEAAQELRRKGKEDDAGRPPRPLAQARNVLGEALRLAQSDGDDESWTAPAIENAFPPALRTRTGNRNRPDWTKYAREQSLEDAENGAVNEQPAVRPAVTGKPKVAKAS